MPRPSGRTPYRAPAVRNYRPYTYGSYYRYRPNYYGSYYYRPYYSYYSPYRYWPSFGWPYYGTSFGFSLAFGYPGYYYPYPGYVAPYDYPGYPYGGAYPRYPSYQTYPTYPTDPSYQAEETAPPPEAGVQSQPGGFGTLSIQVKPAGAEILVDGASWQGPGSDRLVLQLSVGTHRVEISEDGYQTYSADVEVRAGETTPLNVSIPRKQAP